ncbi:MAG TPA: hypothetical protein VG167_01695 [Verrucomicrobiae bacterium]|nr:hypothetical protein [Verrucomicrobiae bacterium]
MLENHAVIDAEMPPKYFKRISGANVLDYFLLLEVVANENVVGVVS